MPSIRKHREACNLSQKELADMLNVTQAAVSHWETGRRVPDANDLIAIAKALHCKVDDLIKED
jgi:transcriptional regulator with XRE-family HTH domain